MSHHRRRSYRDFAEMSGFEIELPSSPDPLGDEAPPDPAPVPPSTTRRLLQSTASSRFSAMPGTSPRKRMFALDVGDEITPQTIFVTVEAGQDGNLVPKAPVGSSVRRRLFGSPTPSQASPQRNIRTTTTTIPLRGLTDDEADRATPRRRRRSSARPGTPAAASAKKEKKKKGTPTPKATKKPRGTPTNPSSDILLSETPAAADRQTPAKKRGRPPKRKSVDAPSGKGDPNSEPTLPRKRGRKARESLGPDQVALLSAANDEYEQSHTANHGREPSKELDELGELMSEAVTVDDGYFDGQGGDEEQDMWMANMSDPPAPGRQPSSERDAGPGFSEPVEVPHGEREPSELEDQGHLPGESDDYAPMMDYDDRSDTELPKRKKQDDFESDPTELDDQGTLPGEPDEVALLMEYDDGSDMEMPNGENHNDVERNATELEDQGPLPGESDDFAPLMEYDDRSDMELVEDLPHGETRNEIERNSVELGDQEPLPGEPDDFAPLMEYDDGSEAESQPGDHPTRSSRDEPDHTVDPESFTMIGIESMPSFRPKRNVPTSEPPELGEETSLFINKTLDSLRQEIAESDEDEVDILVSRGNTPADEDLERPVPRTSSPQSRNQLPQSPVSPGRTESAPGSAAKVREQSLVLSPAPAAQRPRTDSPHSGSHSPVADEDSFSDIPEEVLAAAESQEEWQPSTGPREEQLAWAVAVTKKSAEESASRHLSNRVNEQISGRPQSSQSTPSHSSRAQPGVNEDISQQSASRSVQSRRASGQAMQRSSPPHSARSRTDSNRLLTPDDTTSSSAGVQSPLADQAVPSENDRPATASDDIGSSPPHITTFPEDKLPVLPPRRNSDTPGNRLPDIHVEHVQERHTFAAGLQSSQPVGSRPALSPVVRIGRTLQNILSDPPSPSAHSSVLGSPFKKPSRNSSPLDGAAANETLHNATSQDDVPQTHPPQSPPRLSEPPAQSPTKSWAMSFAPLSQIKNLVAQGAQLFTSPQVDSSQILDDPFGPSSPTAEKGAENTRNSAFMDRIREASREGSAYSNRIGRRAFLGDDDAQRTTSLSTATHNGGAAHSRSPSSRSLAVDSLQSNAQHQVVPIGNFEANDEDADELADDEPLEDSQFEEQPPEDDNMTEEAEDDDVEVGAEKDDTPMSEDGMQLDDAPAGDGESEEEDIWAIEANRTASSPQAVAPQIELSALFRKSELSVDWGTRSTNSMGSVRPGRSPTFRTGRSVRQDPPENLEDYSLVDLHSGTSAQPSAKKPTPEAQQPPRQVDLSDFFSSSPNFMERQRRAKEASLAKSAAQDPVVNVSQTISSESTGQAQITGLMSQKPLPSNNRMRNELPSPAPGASQNTTRESTTRTSSTPERVEHGRRAQPKFTPRRTQNDAALFESWSVSSSRPPTELPSSSEPPSVARSDLRSIERPSTPQDPTDSSFEAPNLRPLPGPTASPSKSCLRSPLKPKPHGMVVEFTSSTASATAPFQVNAGLHNKPLIASASTVPAFPGKENHPSSASNSVNSSPQHKRLQQAQQQQQQQQNVDSPLSQTRWSRRHWLLLDNLLQAYRQAPLEFELRHNNALMASPRQRPSSGLLGKQVSSQGESMVLEQWHLDIVDAFKKDVGGWPEVVLAKRLFALIVGEERRRLGLVPNRR